MDRGLWLMNRNHQVGPQMISVNLSVLWKLRFRVDGVCGKTEWVLTGGTGAEVRTVLEHEG